MSQMNLFIRKLIQNGYRESAIDLIQTIIQGIEAKNKVSLFATPITAKL